MTITINGKEIQWPGSLIDYGAVLSCSKMAQGATVTYRGPNHGDSQRSGSLYPTDQAIVLEEGMIFNCCDTGNA